MISLTELRELARKTFVGEYPDAIRILYAWAESDPGGVLGQALYQLDSDTRCFRDALSQLLDTPRHEETLMISHCLRQAGTGADIGLFLDLLLETRDQRIVRALAVHGIDMAKLTQALRKYASSATEAQLAQSSDDDQHLFGIRLQDPEEEILQYGRDLTELARSEAFSGLLERQAELDLLIDTLLRKNKPNVAITGPAGCGKTALAETLAMRIAQDAVPVRLKGAQLFEIEVAALVAGTRYRGDFEERLKRLLEFLSSLDNAILFIDELHLIAGAGSAQGVTTDASNILKPYLARGRIRVIGATTREEYHRHIFRDKALARRFQELRLTEPEPEMLLDMIRYQAAALSEHHQVRIGCELFSTVLELGNRFFPNRSQPDKSIDLLDNTAAHLSSRGQTQVTEQDLLESLSRTTGHSLENLLNDDLNSLSRLSRRLNERIIGQEKAVEKLTARLVQKRMELGQTKGCRGVFVFAGDRSVGKTSLAKAVGEELFPGSDAVLTVDLGTFSQPGSINNLIGVPRGYRGMDEESLLSTWLGNRPEGVLVLKDADKAHPDVHRLLLGLFDGDRTRDSAGNVLDARQYLIVLTTNVLTSETLHPNPIGFLSDRTTPPDPLELLTNAFPAGLLARMDEIIVFDPLSPTAIRRIVELRLDEAISSLSRRRIQLEFNREELIERIHDTAEVARFGARGIDKSIERLILQPAAKALIAAFPEQPLKLHLEEKLFH